MSAPVALQLVVGLFMFAAVFVPLEHWFPRKDKRLLGDGWLTDVAYYVAGCFVGRFSDAASVGAMLLIRAAMPPGSMPAVATQPVPLQVIEVLMLADFLAYWYHRALHAFPLIWRFHQVHHSSQRMDWLANVRLHPVDKIGGDLFQFVPIFVLGFSDLAVLIYTIFLGFQGFLNHSNVNINFGPWRWIIANPQFHHWHHCDDPTLCREAHNKNFAPHFVIMDWLFGTLYLPSDRNTTPMSFGIAEPFPREFWKQLIYPFVPSRQGQGRVRVGLAADD